MGPLFVETSALAKRYISETGSEWISRLFSDDETGSIYIAELTIVERTSAVVRRLKGGSLSPTEAAKTLTSFDRHLVTDYFILEINSELLRQARVLVSTHGLRGYDAVQLAVAENFNRNQNDLGLPGVTIISADGELLAAAKADGLVIENPNSYS